MKQFLLKDDTITVITLSVEYDLIEMMIHNRVITPELEKEDLPE